jgi:hypothetical protein
MFEQTVNQGSPSHTSIGAMAGGATDKRASRVVRFSFHRADDFHDVSSCRRNRTCRPRGHARPLVSRQAGDIGLHICTGRQIDRLRGGSGRRCSNRQFGYVCKERIERPPSSRAPARAFRPASHYELVACSRAGDVE